MNMEFLDLSNARRKLAQWSWSQLHKTDTVDLANGDRKLSLQEPLVIPALPQIPT